MKLFHPRFILQAIAIVGIVITIGWLIKEPSFETAMAFTTAIAALLTSFFVREEYITTGKNLLPAFVPSNRIKFLRKVRLLWIKGFLEPSLPKGIFIDLKLVSVPNRVANPAAILQTSFSSASDAYFAFNEELLLLGKPGSGKTTLLLKIARELIERGEHDASTPMPVILSLSSWVNKRAALKEWLIEEIDLKYQVSKTISEPWLENNQFALLLDGFDEVPKEHRRACAMAINKFREEYGLTGMVVSSRTDDYQASNTLLRLAGAVEVQPLSNMQIEKFINDVGNESLKKVEDIRYYELLQSPLMLSLLPSISQDQSDAWAGLQPNPIDKIFDLYIKKSLVPSSRKEVPYTENQITDWLTQIALIIQKSHESIFLIDRLQPNWLENKLFNQYVLVSRLFTGMVAGFLTMPIILILGLAGAYKFWSKLELFSISSFFYSLLLMLALILFAGGTMGTINYAAVIIQNKRRKGHFMDVITRHPSIATGTASALLFFAIGVKQAENSTMSQLLFFSSILGVIAGFISKRMFNIRKGWGRIDNDIQPVNALSWSWKSAFKGASVGSVLAIAILFFHPLFTTVAGSAVLIELVGVVVLSLIFGVPAIGGIISLIIFLPLTTIYFYLKHKDLKFLKSKNFLLLQKLVFLTGYGAASVRIIYNAIVYLPSPRTFNLFEYFKEKSIQTDVAAVPVNWESTLVLAIGVLIVTCISLAIFLVFFVVKFQKAIQLKNNKFVQVLRPFIIAIASLFASLLSFFVPEIMLTSILFMPSLGAALISDIPSIIIILSVMGALFSGTSQQTLYEKTVVNQGIKESLQNAIISMLKSILAITLLLLFAFLSGGAFTILFGGALYFLLNPMIFLNTSGSYQGSFGDIRSVLTFSLIAALFLGIISAMWNGGFTVIQHYSLRFLIASRKILPWKLEKFLDYAVSHSLLRKIGGGYIFIHPLMRKHFAERKERNSSVGIPKKLMETKKRSKSLGIKNR
jgi:DNA polymerase III delta prime subunit